MRSKEGIQTHDVVVMINKRGNKFDRTESWEDRHDFVPDGQYMGNCHTLRYHEHGCSDILKMNDEHKVETDNEQGLYRPCGHCKPGMSKFLNTLDNYRTSSDDLPGTEVCYDPKINDIFQKTGCLTCGSKSGIVKMFPDNESGVKLLGKSEKWWVYFECFDCGYQTALWKAQNKLKSMKAREEI